MTRISSYNQFYGNAAGISSGQTSMAKAQAQAATQKVATDLKGYGQQTGVPKRFQPSKGAPMLKRLRFQVLRKPSNLHANRSEMRWHRAMPQAFEPRWSKLLQP
jgi:hypothetical protein